MDKLLEKLSLGDLIRWSAPGVAFYCSIYYAKKAGGIELVSGMQLNGFDIAFIVFVGLIVYGLHRSIVFPFIERKMAGHYKKELESKTNENDKDAEVRKFLLKWWSRSPVITKGNVTEWYIRMEGWADVVHSQYLIAEGVGLGAFVSIVDSLCSANYMQPCIGHIQCSISYFSELLPATVGSRMDGVLLVAAMHNCFRSILQHYPHVLLLLIVGFVFALSGYCNNVRLIKMAAYAERRYSQIPEGPKPRLKKQPFKKAR